MSEKKISPFEQKLNDWVSTHFSKISIVEKIFFVDHLRTMLHAGLSLVEGLDILSKEAEKPVFKKTVLAIKAEIEKGTTFNEAMAMHPKFFPPLYVKMIASGEIAGNLEETLAQVVLQMKKSHELTATIKGAMIYPSVVVTAIFAVGILMITVVLPKIITLFTQFDAELPLATRVLIATAKFFQKPLNMAVSTVLFVSLIVGFVVGLKRSDAFKRRVHALNLRLPIAGGIIKKINLARFTLTLSSLLKSTLPIIQAVENTADTCGNVLYKNSLREVAEKLKSGNTLSEILRLYPALYPPMITEMIMVGEKTGEMDRLLAELADFYNGEVDRTMKNFSTIIEPAIILLLGLGVAGIAVAVISPMFKLMQSF